MEQCHDCHVHVRTAGGFCPLCGAHLSEGDPPQPVPPVNEYPALSASVSRYNFLKRLLLFLSAFSCVMSVLINLLTYTGVLWCLIVVAAAVYCWLTIPPMLRRGVNFAAQILLQVVLTAGLVVALDFILGYAGWSTSYVVPAILSAGILATVLMALFNRTNWAQIVLYQVIVGVFGFVPLLLYALGAAKNLVMVLVTAGLALASLLVTIFFGDRSIKSEFIRRFHF